MKNGKGLTSQNSIALASLIHTWLVISIVGLDLSLVDGVVFCGRWQHERTLPLRFPLPHRHLKSSPIFTSYLLLYSANGRDRWCSHSLNSRPSFRRPAIYRGCMSQSHVLIFLRYLPIIHLFIFGLYMSFNIFLHLFITKAPIIGSFHY